jgi:hypothetical protein
MKPTLIIDKFGDDDNIFNIAGMAGRLAPEKYNDIIDSVISSSNFNEAIASIQKYVDIIFVESA